jgi:DNA-binding transcriptional ArsR family regulator
LAIREQVGDLLAIAKSLGNLGFLYRAMKDYHHAVLAHQEALATYQKLGNRELIAAAWLNIGAGYYHDNKLDAAIDAYRQSFEIGQAMALPLIELKAHYNLAEALAATGHQEQALRHWKQGYQLCQQHNFGDQAADFLELAKEIGITVETPTAHSQNDGSGRHTPLLQPSPYLSADEEMVMELVRREQNITARRLMGAADISRATATRRLTSLAEKGLLTAHGQGRGAYYALAKEPTADDARASALDTGATRETLHALLQREQPALVEQYAVTAVGILPAARDSAKIVVCFAHSPDLASFFTLKDQLAILSHLEIDLLPDFTLSPMQLQNEVAWIWHS